MKAISSPSLKTSSLSRQQFLTLVWKGLLGLSSALGLAGLYRFLSYQPFPAPVTRFDLGPQEELPKQTTIEIQEAQAILIPEEDGLTALSLVCPHLGCLVEKRDNGFLCPCHGSQFEPDGTLRKGPATTDLSHLKLEVDGSGHLILDTEA